MPFSQQDLDKLYVLIDSELDENGWPIPEIGRQIVAMCIRLGI